MEIPDGANNEDLEKLAREYAAFQMRRAIAGEHVERHHINNARDFTKFFLQPDEAEGNGAFELGAMIEKMRGSLTEDQARDDDQS